MKNLKNYRNLVEVVQDRHAIDKGIRFIETSTKEQFYSYETVFTNAVRMLHFLQNQGLGPGDELIFQISNNDDFIVIFWACLLGGIIPVPLTVGRYDEHKLKVFNVWKVLNRPHLITSRINQQNLEKFAFEHDLLDTFSKFSKRTIFVDDVQKTGIGELYAPKESDVAFIQFSSGSTGDPKGVVLTHRNLLTNINAILKSLKSPSKGEEFFSWMPLTHDLGLIGFHLTPLVANYNQFLMQTEVFLTNPILWLRKITEHNITFTSSPNFGFNYVLKYFKPEKHSDIDLASVRLFVNGAEPISADVCRRFVETFACYGLKENVMFPVYGLAEASLAVSFSEPEKAIIALNLDRNHLKIGDKIEEHANPKDSFSCVSVGSAIDDCFVRIVNDDDQMLDAEHIGNIQIKGGNVTSGYYNNNKATRSIFTSDNWLKTGDIGFTKNGSLFITGRAKNIIFINGQNFYSHDIERVAEEVDGIELGKIAVVGCFNKELQYDEIIACIQFRNKVESFISLKIKLQEHINENLGIEIHHVIPVARIPKTTSGKIQRYKLLEQYLNGAFNEVFHEIQIIEAPQSAHTFSVSPANPTEEKLLTLWKAVLSKKQIGTTDNFFACGGNSLKASMLLIMVQREFKVDLKLQSIFDNPTVQKLASEIESAEFNISPAIRPVMGMDSYPVSSSQRGLFFLNHLAKSNTAYSHTQVFTLEGNLDFEKLQRVWQTLVQRHEALRTSFELIDGEPVQKIHPQLQFEAEFERVVGKNVEEKITEFMQEFNLQRLPLIRVKVLQITERKHFLLLNMHHIIADGTSVALLLDEMCQLYSDSSLPEPGVQFKDYVLWKSSHFDQRAIGIQEKFWRSRFGELPVLTLPTYYPRPTLQSFQGKSVSFEIGTEQTIALKNLAMQEEATLFMVLLGIFSILLSKLSTQEDIIVGTPISGRNHSDIQRTVGMFVQTLPLRCFPTAQKIFREFLKELKVDTIACFQNLDYPFEDLVALASKNRDVSRNPLFDVMLVMQNMEIPELHIPGLTLKPLEYRGLAAKFDLTLEGMEHEDRIKFCFEYNTQLFNEDTIDRFISYFRKIIECILIDAAAKIANIEILTAAEKQYLLFEYNDTFAEYSRTATIHKLFETQVARTPNKPAVMSEEGVWTFQDLNKRANQLARILRSRGVGPDCIVVIMIEHSPELIAAIFAVLKSGGAYLPIDPECPPARIDDILRDNGAQLALTDTRTAGSGLNCLTIDLCESSIYQGDGSNLEDDFSSSENLAYVIYTSGSTGRPKGVLINHRNVVNYISWASQEYVSSDRRNFPLFTSIAFDLTVTSVFVPLITGNCLVVYRDEKQALAIETLVQDENIDVIKLTPSHLSMINSYCNTTGLTLKGIKEFIVGGESLVRDLAEQIVSRPGMEARLYNEYGPTETTVGCMIHKFDRRNDTGKVVPIGVPIANTQVYLLDNQQQPVAPGVIGEIYIGGEGVGRGYLNNPESTAERFLDNPFVPGQKIYRTGDLARRIQGGNLEFLGRSDHQVKIKGYRIELAEIEAQLQKHDAIKQAVVLACASPGDSMLEICAYIVAEKKFTISELRAFLLPCLPGYMIPNRFIQTESIPVNANGKVDRNALEKNGMAIGAGDGYQKPESDAEQLLAEVWQDVLRIEKISANDNFFELGGDSIKALQVVARLNDLGVAANLKDILHCQTIALLSSRLEFRSPVEKYQQGNVTGEKNLAPIDLWFFDQSFPALHYYNQSVLLECRRKLNVAILRRSFEKLIDLHDGLRLNYDQQNNRLFYNQQHLNCPFAINTFDIPLSAKDAELQKIGSDLKSGFDLNEGLLIKAAAIKFSDDAEFLLITAHHLIIDGFSWRILLYDLYKIYKAFKNGEDFRPAKTASLQDWYNALLEFSRVPRLSQEVDYWNEIEQTCFDLPLDFSTDQWHTKNHQRVSGTLEGDRILQKDVHRVYNTDILILLTTALAMTLKQWLGESTFVIEMENHGRHLQYIDVSRTVGWFTCLFPIKLHLRSNGVGEQIKETKEQLRRIPNHGLGYGVLKYLRRELKPSRAERSRIRLNYLGVFEEEIDNDFFALSDYSTGSEVAEANHMTTEIEINCKIIKGVFECEINYNKLAFKVETMQWLRDTFFANLNTIIAHLLKDNTVYFTPSDFDTVEISEDEIAALFQ